MEIHKLIDSAEAAVYLPFALSKLRWLDANAGYYVSQKYVINGVTILLKHDPVAKQQSLQLLGGFRYEFFTSDAISFDGGYGTPPYVGAYNTSIVLGHSTAVYAGQTGFRPSAMSSWNGLNGAPVLDPVQTTDTDIPRWIGRASYNNQKIAFHHEYTTSPSATRPVDRVEYSTTPAAGRAAFANDNVPKGSSGTVINTTELGGDIGWDVRQPVYRNNKRVARLQPLLKPPFWWRRGTVAMAADAQGEKHPITIVTDAMSNFYFFRTLLADEHTVAHPDYVERYVPPEKCVKVEASSFLPGWVEQPTIDTMRPYLYDQTDLFGYNPASTAFQFDFPSTASRPYVTSTSMPDGDGWTGSAIDNTVQVCEYLWSFNSDGTAAAAVVHEDKGPAKHSMFGHGSGLEAEPIKVMRWGYVDLWIPAATESEKAAYFAAHGGLDAIRLRQRGLVSVSIDISITGPGPTDFTATITPTVEIKDRHFLEVDFAMKHPGLEELGVNRDDLIASEVEVYLKDAVDKYSPGNEYEFFTVRNWQTGIETTPLLRFKTSYMLLTVDHVTKISVLDFGNLSGDPPPYGKIFISPNWHSYNAMQYWFDLTFDGDYDPHGYLGNTVLACDLKSLSFIMATSATPWAANRGSHLYVFGKLEESSGNVPATALTTFPDVSTLLRKPEIPTRAELDAAGYTTREPYDYYARYALAARSSVSSWANHLLDVHPAGHYAAYHHTSGPFTWNDAPVNELAVDPVIDTIAYCTIKPDGTVAYTKTTHKKMFNMAFQQDRTYAGYNELGVFHGGMFAAAGMWV